MLTATTSDMLNCPARASTYEKTTEISKQLKAIALSEKSRLFAVCQLNRQPEQRQNHRPLMSDLRDSGGIEQDADVILLLHCEDYTIGITRYYKPTGTQLA